MELPLSRIQGALATTTARTTKTSLAIKMNTRFLNFYLNSFKMANIGELPYGVYVTAPKFGLREETEFVPVFTSSKRRRKRKFTVLFVQVVKKSALDVQNLLLFIYLLGSLPSPSPSSLLPGSIDVPKRLGIVSIRTLFQ